MTINDLLDWLDKVCGLEDIYMLNQVNVVYDIIDDYKHSTDGTEEDDLESLRDWMESECEDCPDDYFIEHCSIVEDFIFDFMNDKEESE